MTGKSVAVIGGGFAGLATACYLAKAGREVTLYEKHDQTGGRARYFEAEGFRFDMGPSWYWMPDTFERFFADFGKSVEDYYSLTLLDPGFRMYTGPDEYLDVPANTEALKATLEALEPGSADAYDKFMRDAAIKYRIGMQDLVERPCLSPWEFFSIKVLRGLLQMQLLTPFDKFVRRFFTHEKIIKLMEFPVLFLGAAPNKTPALYSLMNYAGLELGTWYPEGGMQKIVRGMEALALELGVTIKLESEVQKFALESGQVKQIVLADHKAEHDVFVSAADYHFTEQNFLPRQYRNYSEDYWDGRAMAPSSLLFYIGLDREVPDVVHHNLFFDADFDLHAEEIYEHPSWPTNPLFYLCCPSKTDKSVAPAGSENLFILMPLAAGLKDQPALREKYFDIIADRLQRVVGFDLREHITYQRNYCIKDFKQDYGAYRGNAYGLANTLRQTAILKPRIKNRKLPNLYYAGQLTVPGPGVPPSLISGKIVANQIINDYPLKLQQ